MNLSPLKLACQEHLIPGDSLLEKWHLVSSLGYQGIELRGHGDFALKARLPELRQARKGGAFFPSVCVIMDHFIGDFDKGRRLDALENMKSQISVIAELGGNGAITPASFGMHSEVLPPFKAPRNATEDRAILLDNLGVLGEHAAAEGVCVYLEPLNRYEDHMLNTLEQGAVLCDTLALSSVRLMADLFHMNIEEDDLLASLERAASHIAHIHLADSNRYEPGQGHTDFQSIGELLEGIGYSGFMALECSFREDAVVALRKARALF